MNDPRQWLKRNPENFPVASWLLPRAMRAAVLALYGFARGADEIADDKNQSPEQRRHQLQALEKHLIALDFTRLPDFALPYAGLAQDHHVLIAYGRDLLSAFVQDTIKTRYHSYNDLLDYCQRSAVPIGRAFLSLCSEKADPVLMDSLCIAMQLLNHIRDCSDDYVNRDQVYLPLDWFTFAQADIKMLAQSECDPKLRKVLDRGLDICETLLKKSAPLTGRLHHSGVAREVAWIYEMALALCRKLRTHDPLAGKVTLSPLSVTLCLFRAVLAA